MNRRNIFLLVILVALSVAPLKANDDHAAIRATIQAYADGYNTRDRGLLERAFDAKRAHMKSFVRVKDGPDRVKVTAITDWIDKITAKGDNREANVRVLSITTVNDHIANVFLDFDGSLYDMMLVAKIDGAWKIVNKVSIYQDPDKH